MNQKTIQTDIIIKAKATEIWQVLTNIEAYPEWNPFIKSLEGKLSKGAKLNVVLMAPGGKPMNFKPLVLELKENQSFKWLGHLFTKGLFDGEHCFEINELGDGICRFRQSENFSGLLVPLFNKMLDKQTKRGFEEMNLALKMRVENKH